MLLELAILLLLGLLLVTVVLVIYKAIIYKLTVLQFKKSSRGLPMFQDFKNNGNTIIAVSLSENNCQLLRKCHEQLGKTIGFTKGDKFGVSTVDLDLIKTFIFDEPDAHLDRSKPGLPMVEIEESIMLAPKDEWRVLRKAIAPALTSNKFKSQNVTDEMQAAKSKLIDYIEKKLDTESDDYQFDVNDFVHKYSLDLVFRCFYKQDQLINFDDPKEHWTNHVDENFQCLQQSPFVKLSIVFPIFRGLIDWLVWHFTPQGVFRKEITGFIKVQTKLALEARKQLKEIEAKARETGDKVDINDFVLKGGIRFKRNMVDYIIDHFLDGKMTKEQYFNNSCFLMGAADKTATDALTHTIYLLSIHPDVQEKLRTSIRANGEDSEYLEWVLKESLRLLPPAPIGCSRTITRDIPIEGGYIVPAGTFVHTNAFIIHRLKKYWGDDADEFRPERWQDTSNHHPCQYIPFGAGLRGCPGKAFAMHKMKMLMSTLLTRYKFTGQPKDDAYVFNAPLWIFVIPNTHTMVKISRL
uniref:Cytochrome P450 3A4 n=1 Tax=Aceria tosichella TaxID=561515 RepID=A0A6G1SC58_9ACAR